VTAVVEVHLYGQLRRFAENRDPTGDSIVPVPVEADDTVASVAARLGIHQEELGTNVFVNGRYARPSHRVQPGDRIGLFPTDMNLLYRWYFAPVGGDDHG